MPAAVAVPAIISAVGAAASTYASVHGANKAAKTQEQANSEALQFEREKEAARRAEYEKAYGIWQAGRQALAQRYGLPIDAIGGSMPPGGAPPAGGAVRSPAGNIRGMMAPGAPQAGVPAGVDLAAGPGKWDDWRNYGLGSPQGA